MIVDSTIDQAISQKLIADNEEERLNHKSSGKLSASKLGWPLQHQILSSLGIEQAPFDAYTLRKFLRGKTVEDWLVSQMPGVKDSQKFVEYRDTVGYLDVLVDSSEYDFKAGNIPHEIKSVTNAKFKRLGSKPDDHHALQAGLYALALDSDYFAVDYVASDDLRIKTYISKTTEYKYRIDNIIDTYQKQMETGIVPVFKPLYSWQKNPKYNSYKEWADLNQEQINKKILRLNKQLDKLSAR